MYPFTLEPPHTEYSATNGSRFNAKRHQPCGLTIGPCGHSVQSHRRDLSQARCKSIPGDHDAARSQPGTVPTRVSPRRSSARSRGRNSRGSQALLGLHRSTGSGELRRILSEEVLPSVDVLSGHQRQSQERAGRQPHSRSELRPERDVHRQNVHGPAGDSALTRQHES